MKPLEITKYPQRVLRSKCKPLKSITEREKALFEIMLYTMRHFSGIGLAAPQVGIAEKIIVAEVEGNIIKLANPEIIEATGEGKMAEGCLSIPELAVEINRPYSVRVKGLNPKNEIIEIKAAGITARVLQHEIDHLKGKLIAHYLPFWSRMKFKLIRQP